MTGLLIILTGLVLGGSGWALLRSSGDGWRLGRLLAAAPRRSLEEAVEAAAHGAEAYVRLHGRIDSDEEFPAEDGKPLVFRRRRLQQRVERRPWSASWQTFDDERLAVPFGLRERGVRVGIDVETLGDGLVVVPRLSTGVAADLPATPMEGPAPALAADAPVRLRIEQVSSTDHGTACGVPRLTDTGETVLGPGLGRPLILTNLGVDEAMRVLGSHQRGRLLAASGLLVAGTSVTVAGLVALTLGL
jgi:hypothetical protein